jgi:hypothetical protein
MAINIPISLDDEKRLVLSRSAAEKIARGRLKLGSRVKVSDLPDGTSLPERLALDGSWKLNERHDLEFAVSASSVWFPGMTILFKTGVVRAGGDKIVFSARLTDYGSFVMSSALSFSGRWQADKNNRLNFSVTRYAGKTDRLVFQGAWEIAGNNELFYTYSKRKLKTKEKQEFSFGLKGAWDLGPRRIAYKLEGSGDAALSFSAALETPSIRAKDGRIRYSVGVRFTSGGREREVIKKAAIFGTWKLGRDLSLGFEAETTAKGKNVITFSAEKPVLKGGNLLVGLKTQDGRKFGAQLKFSKTLSPDAEIFASLSADPGNKSVMAGFRRRF